MTFSRSAKSFARSLLLSAVAICITLGQVSAQTSGLDPELRQWLTEPGRTYPLVTATVAGREIQLYDFGPTTISAGDVYRLPDGTVLFSTIPSSPAYSALRMIYDVAWIGEAPNRPAHSLGEVLGLVRRGAARLTGTNIVLNLPVVPAGSALERDPESRPLRGGWYEGQPVNYFDFGPARPGVVRPSAGSVPGQPGYSDLCQPPKGTVRNCPVVYVEGKPASRTLVADRGTKTPTRRPPPPSREIAPATPAPAPLPVATSTGPTAAASAPPPTSSATGALIYSGFARQIAVRPPRIERDLEVVDGTLTDSAWSRAAVLTGFSQFQPLDGIPADDSTEVLVWYSPHAIYFGIRAFEAHGAVHATLADRDKIGADDNIQVLLDTFDDHRRALVFGANPFGVQSDGNLTEGLQAKGGGGLLGPSTSSVRDTADLSADYSYQSKGHLVDYGYEVVIRVPFKSIRYQSVADQTWGINVVRRVQHSGREHSWTPARRANASFLSQSGTLVGLHDLQRGLVMDLNPVVTSKVSGAPTLGGGGWTYDTSRPQFGGNVRWGITNNLNLNGTVKPDFSQVEADVQQVVFEPRAALFYPEKRPFFLDGIETFESPTPLIYTRRVIQPVTAAKLTGKVGGATVGLLSAVDDKFGSATGTNYPIYNMLRVKRDLGAQSTGGVIYTDKIDGDDYNRVAALDTRIVFGKIWSLTAQGAGSLTRTSGVTSHGPMFGTIFERSGRAFSLRYNFSALSPDFHAESGFISRENYAIVNFGHHLTFFGKPGGLVETVTLSLPFSVNWSRYDYLFHGGPMGDIKNDNSFSIRFRGGWQLGGLFFPESFKYDPDLYADYALERHQGAVIDTVPFTGTDRLQNWDIGGSVQTPQWAAGDAFVSVLSGQDENFFEWSSAWVYYITAAVNLRPTNKIRINAAYQRQQFLRMTDWTTVGDRHIPRLKIEYQVARPIFLRVVAQYDIQKRDSLRDDSRTEYPILIRNGAGVYQRALPYQRNNLRVDWLFSWQPNPGTVLFAGYGSSLTETDAFKFQDLHRVTDGFFVKFSYLFHM